MSPAAAAKTKKASPEILMVANAAGETIKVAKPRASRSKAKTAVTDGVSLEGGEASGDADATSAANKVSPTKASKTKAGAAKTAAA